MPTYDMICDACGHKCEVFHGMMEPHPKKCPNPECRKNKLRLAFDKAPYFVDRYSPMHPRAKRGRG